MRSSRRRSASSSVPDSSRTTDGVPRGSFWTRTSKRLASADPAGLLYGAIVSAAVLATVSAHAEGAVFVGAATTLVLVVYWLAHVYVHALAQQFYGDTGHILLRLRSSAAHETSVLKGGVPAVLVYTLTHLLGAETSTAATAAVYFSVILLGAVGCLGALQAGLKGRALLLEVAGAGSFGVLIVAAKTLLH